MLPILERIHSRDTMTRSRGIGVQPVVFSDGVDRPQGRPHLRTLVQLELLNISMVGVCEAPPPATPKASSS